MIDAVPRGGAPGTLYLIEPDVSGTRGTPDAHGRDLASGFALAATLGGELPPVTLVGCEPAEAEETIGLSEPVRGAIAPALELVRRLVADALRPNRRAAPAVAEKALEGLCRVAHDRSARPCVKTPLETSTAVGADGRPRGLVHRVLAPAIRIVAVFHEAT